MFYYSCQLFFCILELEALSAEVAVELLFTCLGTKLTGRLFLVKFTGNSGPISCTMIIFRNDVR
jgi:hypothetical protein